MVFTHRKLAVPILICLLACYVIASAQGGGYLPASKSNRDLPYNVVLIIIDSLRPDYMGGYGYFRNTSPRMDEVAGEGVIFNNCISQRSLTHPSITSIFSSKYVKTHGVTANGMVLDPHHMVIGELMSEAGYLTAGFLTKLCSNHFVRGLDTVYCYEYHRFEDWETEDTVTAHALSWLEENQDERFYLWLMYKDPHWDYHPPPPYDTLYDPGYTGPYNGDHQQAFEICQEKIDLSPEDKYHWRALYAAQINSTDEYVGIVLDKLDSLGLTDSTLVVVVGDHGEELLEHGWAMYHGMSIYRQCQHVPLLMKLPAEIAAGSVVENQVQCIDILPTILDAVGLEHPSGLEGESLWELIFDPGYPHSSYAFQEGSHGLIHSVMRDNTWHYIYNPYWPAPCIDYLTEELYNMAEDPSEDSNLVDLYPELADTLRGELLNWLFPRQLPCDIDIVLCRSFPRSDKFLVAARTTAGERSSAHLIIHYGNNYQIMQYDPDYKGWSGWGEGSNPGMVTIESLCQGTAQCRPTPSRDLMSDNLIYGYDIYKTPSGIDRGKPQTVELWQNRPNPFNPVTGVRYFLPKDCHVSLKVYNLLGEEVTTLFEGNQSAGLQEVSWDATEVPCGVYFCKLSVGGMSRTIRMVVLK